MLTAVLVLLVVVAVVVGCVNGCGRPDPKPTFDEHAATALALLQPDHPDLPESTPFADEVEAWLATEHTQEQP
ncbi:hypothetical protein [Micromonospora sp. CB01531]|uniref:hypothetical protein n=1 Tax=Micromonospora sp. CB01531 TaxID=1718947 RepID=UPI00093B1229|nr:hypothetical protein [Micromonospora sp. CB01531]OKI47270.1 hypothetical protein A6A27_10505 [Micromonospora sp. CB01531]